MDTSQIPTIALERVEILKEGAASVYGSDAIAGVVNYIFRRDFTGFEVDITRQQIDATSSARDDRASFIYGGEWGDANVVVAYSTLDRSPMPGSAKNLSPMGVSGLGTSFRNVTGGVTVADANHPWYGTNGSYSSVFIGDPNCVANGGTILPDGRCGFAFGPRFNIVNTENHSQTYASIELPLDNGVDLNFDALISRTDVWDNPQSPSYPALSFLSAAKLIQPGTGGSPFAQPVMWFGRPFGSAYPSPDAPRDIYRQRLSLGATGTFDNGFDWDFRVTRTGEDGYGRQPDVGTTQLDAAIAGTGGPTGDQTFDLSLIHI